MNTPVVATSSYRPHTEETMARLADWGFTHIVMCQPQGGHWRQARAFLRWTARSGQAYDWSWEDWQKKCS